MKKRPLALLCIAMCLLFFAFGSEQAANERTFPQSKAVVENALKRLQPFTSGKLPTLDGFAVAGETSLDRFQRGFYQCSVQVLSNPAGGSLVRVAAKITAWYAASTPADSGYRVLASNGRLESDLLDRLQDALSQDAEATVPSANSSNPSSPAKHRTSNHGKSAATATGSFPDARSNSTANQVFQAGTPADSQLPSIATQKAVADRHLEALRTDAKNLEEILRTQSHPTNLVAVKQAGTPIFAAPNEGGKVLFRAAAEDEFEVLDLNASWVHVRISGLSRGWIQRSRLELSDEAASNTAAPVSPPASPPSTPAAKVNAPRFQVEHEEIATFPADWEPLRGKTVKIISVQPTMPTGGDSQAKLDFSKSLFDKSYAELIRDHTTAAGVLVIFDSVDGGMVGTTIAVLRQWKQGVLSDEAMWRRCYVDPPQLLSRIKD